MPNVCPFRGVLYNPRKIKNLAQVVTEPYDVISPLQKRAYYKTNPYNIIRLILGKDYADDTAENNKYTRAKDFFQNWLAQGILSRDHKECIYIYAQNFSHHNRKRTRTGFIALLKLEDFAKNAILPHENTFSQPVQDRLRLLKAVGANLSPIFALFSDQESRINKLLNQYKKTHRPYIVFEKEKTIHRLWRMSDKKKIMQIRRLLKRRQIFIADGHHRYEAALNYKSQIQKNKQLKRDAFNYVMTYLATTTDPGIAILPTHRVVKFKGPFKSKEVILSLKKLFQVHKFKASDELFSNLRSQKKSPVLGLYFKKNNFYTLKLKEINSISRFLDKKSSHLHKNLDVTVLHKLILEHILNIRKDIFYTRDAQEAITLVDANKYQAAFFLKPATVKQVKKMATSGERMPHKSTYFYPKLLTGLVMHKF